jgi:hypothetical protein
MCSLLEIFFSALVAFLAILGCIYIGRILLIRSCAWFGVFRYHYALALGAAVQGLALSLIAILNIAYSEILLFLFIFPLILIIFDSVYFLELVNFFSGRAMKVNLYFRIPSLRKVIIFFQMLLILYVFVFCFTGYKGADLAIYHLNNVRDIIWNHGFRYNNYSFAAGIPLGWHSFGAPSFLIAAESAFLGLTFWFFIAFINFVSIFINNIKISISVLYADLAVLTLSFIVVVFLQGSVPNNDLPATYLEIILFLMVLDFKEKKSKLYGCYIGLLSGFIIAIKLTSIVGVAISLITYFILCFLDKSLKHFLLAILIAIAFSIIWPVVTLFNSGSFLPQALIPYKFFGTYLNQFTESAKVIEMVHSHWYSSNAVLFSGQKFLVPLLISGIFFYVVSRSFVLSTFNTVILFGVSYALIRFILFVIISPRLDVIFHDRYHLVTYILLAFLGFSCWVILLRDSFNKIVLKRFNRNLDLAYIALGLIFFGLCSSYKMNFPDAREDEPRSIIIDSIPVQIANRLKIYLRGPEWESDLFFSYVRKYTNDNDIIATTLMAPYDFNRKYIQLHPVAQNMIDLDSSPKEILRLLKIQGVTYLHINPYPGLVPGATPLLDHYLNNLYKIPEEPGVVMILKKELVSGKFSALYKINSFGDKND